MAHRLQSKTTLLHCTRTLCAILMLAAAVAPVLLTSHASAQSDRKAAAQNAPDAAFPTEQRMQEGLRFAVAQGELQQEQADMIMRVFHRLSKGIESGRLSASDAMGIMEQRARAIYAGESTKDAANPGDSSEMIIRITAALEAGDITPTQAAEYILIMQRSIAAEDAYADFEAKIAAAVRNGEMTREDAGLKIEAFKKELHERMLAEFKERMTASIEDGSMTEEDADNVWLAYKKMNFEDDEPRITRQDYAEAQTKMQKMVDAGEITRAQMKTRLGEMRRMIGKGTSKTGTPAKLTRQDYAEAQAKMQEMVDAGEMTEEEMNGRLNRMRKKMGAGSKAKTEERSRNDVSADCMELRRTLGDAIRAGEMTREEAGVIWRNEGC